MKACNWIQERSCMQNSVGPNCQLWSWDRGCILFVHILRKWAFRNLTACVLEVSRVYFTLQLEWNYFRRTSLLVVGVAQEATDSTQGHFSVCLWNSSFWTSHPNAFQTLGKVTGFDSQDLDFIESNKGKRETLAASSFSRIQAQLECFWIRDLVNGSCTAEQKCHLLLTVVQGGVILMDCLLQKCRR